MMPSITRTALAISICWLAGTVSDDRSPSLEGTGAAGFALRVLDTAAGGTVAIWEWGTRLYAEQPTTFWTLLVVGALVYLAFNAHRLSISNQRDPQRIYTGAQRSEIAARAGGRCEHKHLMWVRCNTPGSHADHVYPWSRGGATTVANAQWLCQRHNLRKSNRVPTRTYLLRLQLRRRRYFPPGEPTGVDWTLRTAATYS